MADVQQEALASFVSITGVSDVEKARFYLDSSKWSVDAAVSAFFDADGKGPSPFPAPTRPPAASDAVPRRTRGRHDHST